MSDKNEVKDKVKGKVQEKIRHYGKEVEFVVYLILCGWVLGFSVGHGLNASGWSPVNLFVTQGEVSVLRHERRSDG